SRGSLAEPAVRAGGSRREIVWPRRRRHEGFGGGDGGGAGTFRGGTSRSSRPRGAAAHQRRGRPDQPRRRAQGGRGAYPEKALNPIHAFAPALAELAAERWDEGNADFPPTSFQVSNLNAGTGANNVIPGELVALINFRYCTASRAEDLRARTEAILTRHGLDFALEWNLSGEPFLTPPGGKLRETVVAVCRELCGTEPEQSTGGGTSDGRFIAPLGVEVVELGPVNATIHK